MSQDHDITKDAPSRDLISPRQSEMMLQWIEGRSVEDIALRFGVKPEKVRAVLRLRAVKQEITRLSQLTRDELLRDRLGTIAGEAIDTLRDTMRGTNTSELKFKAAKELLDKTPALKQDKNSLARDVGEGIGEAIIHRLAEIEGREWARQRAIDVTPEPNKEEGSANAESDTDNCVDDAGGRPEGGTEGVSRE